MNHFANKAGYDAIRSQPTWLFRAQQPPPRRHPPGAYFTTFAPSEEDLARKLRIPKDKIAFLFTFADAGDLLPLPGGRGWLDRIFYSPKDYRVERPRQEFQGQSADCPPLDHTGGATS